MGCNNSHLRPLFRRCRRRSKNKDDTSTAANCTPKRQQNDLIDSNHVDANTSSSDILHGIQFIGSSVSRQSSLSKQSSSDVSSSDAPACVPLLAQSEISHSQIDFFRMLDEKIQQGPDYDSEEDREESRRLIRKNIETWNRKATSNSWKVDYSRLANSSPSTARCQWDEDGDGG